MRLLVGRTATCAGPAHQGRTASRPTFTGFRSAARRTRGRECSAAQPSEADPPASESAWNLPPGGNRFPRTGGGSLGLGLVRPELLPAGERNEFLVRL